MCIRDRLRVAQLALEGSSSTATDAEQATSSAPGTASEAAAESSQASVSPADAPQRSGTSSLPPPPSALQTASKSAAAPDASRDVDSPANGEPPLHGATANSVDAPRNSAEVSTTETVAQTDTAVATQVEMGPMPNMVENGQAENNALTNEEPREEKRLS